MRFFIFRLRALFGYSSELIPYAELMRAVGDVMCLTRRGIAFTNNPFVYAPIRGALALMTPAGAIAVNLNLPRPRRGMRPLVGCTSHRDQVSLRWIKSRRGASQQPPSSRGRGSGTMRKYLVTFYRIILDGAGHDRRVVQRRAVIRSRSEVTACWEAKAMFCRAAGIADWRLRADACEVAEVADAA